MAGYAKYLVPCELLGAGVTLGTAGVKLIMTSVDKLLKRHSDYETVDEFLDLDRLIEDCQVNAGVNKNSSKFRDRFRKRAMLQLGFANTKTFFTHVANKLGELVHNIIDAAKDAGRDSAEYNRAKPFINLVRSMELKVDIDGNNKVIPTASKIAGKLGY